MTPLSECPDRSELLRHAQDEVPRGEAMRLDAHLHGCPSCLDEHLKNVPPVACPAVPECRVVKEIGSGRFGIVYKAWWLREAPKLVALKVLHPLGSMETRRFEREINVLRKIDSPFIVKCLDSGQVGDARYFLMDYVEGTHLDDYFRADTRDLPARIEVFQRVCQGVADAHAVGVIHRDLKPRNILVTDDGQPRILDFGICAVGQGEGGSSGKGTLTQPGDLIGTLKYMSPEQAWGGAAGPIDERSDIWALGIMLHEILTGGQYPYPVGATADLPAHEALLERIRKELPRPTRCSHLPRGRELEVLVQRCLTWEPERRIASAGALADDLERYCQGRRIRTKPHSVPYRLRRLAVGAAIRSRWMFSLSLTAAAASLLVLVSLLFHVGWFAKGQEIFSGGSSPFSDGAHSARERVLIAGITDETYEHVAGVAASAGIDGVTSEIPTWRGIHGLFMERLAVAGPRAVVWDYYFRSSQESDEQLLQGIERLEQAGIPVLLAALDYDDHGRPDLSPAIVQRLGRKLRHGSIAARSMVERPGEYVLAIRRGGEGDSIAIPSLPLTTLASLLHREARLELDWTGRHRRIGLLYETYPRAFLRPRDQIEATRVFQVGKDFLGTRAGDLLACGTFSLDQPANWQRRCVPYHELLSVPEEPLRQLVENKVLLVGDLRSQRAGMVTDLHPVDYGAGGIENVPGCFLIAEAIAGLLEQRIKTPAFPPTPPVFAAILILGAVGSLLPIRCARWGVFSSLRARRVLSLSLWGLCAVALVAVVLGSDRIQVQAAMGGVALLLPMAGCFGVEFARNRHRVLDRGRGELADRAWSMLRTVTLPTKPDTPMLKTR
jgi:serine/threonine protein kinase